MSIKENNYSDRKFMYENNPLLTISEVSKRLHIPKYTLRFWEREFGGILVPQKTPGGQRRYTSQNITVIEEIKKLRNKGMSLSDIKRALNHSTREENSSKIDLLAYRVAEVVKVEVYNFFKEENT